MSYLIYEAKAKVDTWLKVMLGGIVVFTLIIGLLQFPANTADGFIVIGMAALELLIFRTVFPRRFQIIDDKLRIVFGAPFSINIPLEKITEVRSRTGMKAFYYAGLRFATSAGETVEVVRKGGFNLVFSPEDHEEFIRQLNQAKAGLAG